jgi:D-alanyl-D-alanine carboxypeptidase/D-alanyl-D-alanine-endopeptidase (penicillin-binding protein 4)
MRFFGIGAIILFSISNLTVAQSVSSVIESYDLNEVSWSVSVRDISGQEIESHLSQKLIIPASNQKLYSTAAVLDGLGSTYTYDTVILGAGKQSGNTWIGDLIIVGSGDPSISGFLYDEDKYFVFNNLSEQLKAAGITNVTGAIIGNVSLFDSQVYPKGWDWDDLSFYYGVEVSPLSFNNNAVDLIVDANGDIGESPDIMWFPENTDYVTFQNDQVIAHRSTKYDEFYRRMPGSNEIILGSSLPQGYLEKESLSVNNAAAFFLHSFDSYLNNNGITTGKINRVDTQQLTEQYSDTLAVHKSKPLYELIEWTNKESDNFYTEMMVKTLAAEKGFIPSTYESGINLIKTFLSKMDIDTAKVEMKDASGMASGNLTKTSALSRFLVAMKSHSEFDVFYNSLSVAGIDGTIAHRMKGTELYNNFRGKSGYVGGVRTLSGYFKTRSGKELIVSLSANNFIGKVRPIDQVHEQILSYLYNKY